MINKLSGRHSSDDIENYKKYIVQCPCCGTMLGFGKDDVYVAEDGYLIHHEYIDCPECNEKVMLSDDERFGY